MARFADAVLFTPTSGGTTDFTVSAAVQGFMTPALSGAAPTGVYKYRAESVDLTQWEMGEGTYTSGTGVLTRTTVYYNSAGTGTAAGQSGAGSKINFTVPPQVGIVQMTADTLAPDQALAWTGTQKSQARANIGATVVTISDTAPASPNDGDLWFESDTGTLYFRYNDGTSTQWVGITTNANIAAVLYTSQSLTSAQKDQARKNIGVPQKNYLLNSAMMISQENGTTAGTTASYYPVDQFAMDFSNGGTVSAAQVASKTPGGSPNRVRITVTSADASVAAGDYFQFTQAIEGLRAADLNLGLSTAKTFTLQFGVKAPAGTYCVALRNAAFNRAYIAEYVISAGEANTDVVKSVTLTGDLTGTWLSDTGRGLTVGWCLMCGTTYQQAAGSWGATNTLGSANQFNFFGTNGNVFELFDVSLTEGSVAPPYQVPDYASELLACMRYYTKNVYVNNSSPATGFCYNTTLAPVGFSFPVGMRVTPVITVSNATHWSLRVGGTGLIACTSYATGAASYQAARLDFTVASGLTLGQGVGLESNNALAAIILNARL